MDKKDKRKKILKVAGLIGLFLIVFGLSYALFTVTLNGTKKVKIKTGKLELQLLDSSNNPIYTTDGNATTSYEINLDEQVPVSDEVGLDTQAFEFKLKNTGNIKASYTIYLDDVALEEGESRIDDQYVKYSLTKNGTESTPALLSTTVTENERQLDKGTIDTDNTTYTYTLKIWIAEDATNEAMDKVFNATLRVEGTQYVAPESPYGTKIAETQISETITATYYQPEGTGYNTSDVKRMSNVKKIDNETTYEGGTLVISGTGAIPDYDPLGTENGNSEIIFFLSDVSSMDDIVFDEYDNPTFKYKPMTLIIDEGITSVGNANFYSLNSIVSVYLPSTLLRIGDSAFLASSLQSINLNEGLTYIGEEAFMYSSLSEIRIPSTVTSIGDGVFEACNSLETIYLHGGINQIEFNAFNGSISNNTVIYCETDDVAALVSGYENVIVDPSKFE